jgi:hypothetical protein
MLTLQPTSVTDPLFGLWIFLLRAVYDPTNRSYRYCGAKGIEFQPEWFNFETFRDDVGAQPSREYWLIREDQSLGFIRGNMKWVVDERKSGK